jgi:hypothetical protein
MFLARPGPVRSVLIGCPLKIYTPRMPPIRRFSAQKARRVKIARTERTTLVSASVPPAPPIAFDAARPPVSCSTSVHTSVQDLPQTRSRGIFIANGGQGHAHGPIAIRPPPGLMRKSLLFATERQINQLALPGATLQGLPRQAPPNPRHAWASKMHVLTWR